LYIPILNISPNILPVTTLADSESAKKSEYFLMRRIILIALFVLIPFHSVYSQWLTGYQHRKSITIPASEISGGPHIDFPVLITTTDADLRSQASDGNMLNNNAWDISFSADNVSILDHQVESYNPATGQITVW
jgi:hypothetical protein